jgi:hypothetical protein
MSNSLPSSFDVSACPKLLGAGIDVEANQLFNSAMRLHQEHVASVPRLRAPQDAKGAVQWWTLAYARLIFETCDAARVLATHNLGKACWTHQRQAFEYLIRAGHFLAFPDEALKELRSEPLRRLKLAIQRGQIDGEPLAQLKRDAAEIQLLFPDLAKFELRPFEQMIPNESRRGESTYAKHYRLASITTHGSVLYLRDAIKIGEGVVDISFDSRVSPDELDMIFSTLAGYLLTYSQVLSGAFDMPAPVLVEKLLQQFQGVDERLKSSRRPDG